MKPPIDCESIDEIRFAIDSLDQQILALLGSRFQYVKEIVRFKSNEEEILAQKRYDEVITRRKELALQNGLDPEVIEQVYKTLIQYFIREELKIFNKKDKE